MIPITPRNRQGCGPHNGEHALQRAKREWLTTAEGYDVSLDEDLLDTLLRGLQARARRQGTSLDAAMHANVLQFLTQPGDEPHTTA